jgi:hypothetical protein
MESGTRSGSATIIGNTISQNRRNGVYKSSGSIQIIHNNITSNNVGVAVTPFIKGSFSFQEKSGDTIIRHNSISNNTLYSIESIGPQTNTQGESININSTFNWWGTTDTQAISQTIYDFNDNYNRSRVDFIPFLNAPIPDTFNITASAGANGAITPNGSIILNYDDSQNFIITPSTGYHVVDVLVDGSSIGPRTAYTFSNMVANHTISVTFAINTYTITVTQTANGIINPGTTTINYGTTPNFTITPNSNYYIASITANGVLRAVTSPSGQTYQFSAVTSDGSLTATFAINTYTITVTQTSNGNINPGNTAVNYSNNQTFNITPNIGYHITDVVVDSISQGAVSKYTFTNVSTSHTITANFAINTYNLTTSHTATGNINPATATVNYGGSQTFTITPNTGYHIASLTVDGSPVAIASSYTFTNIVAAHSITATFAINTYSITVTQTANGNINPGTTTVNYGDSPAFTITPSRGYYIASITTDAGAVTVTSSSGQTVIFTVVQSAHTLTATYEQTPTLTPAPTATPNPTPEPTVTPNPTEAPLLTSTQISISVDASSAAVGASVNINGKLSDINGNPMPSKTVTLSYTLAGSTNKATIGSDSTNTAGEYSLQWVNTASGTFTLTVEFGGDTVYQSSSNTTMLNFLPYQNQNVFWVESNSTVTALAFNSTSSELSFGVSGPSDTTGYVRVTIARSLISNPESIKVYLDGNQLNYTVTSNADSWQLTFNYHHSMHQVKIDLGTNHVGPALLGTNWILIVAIAIIAIIGVAALVIWRKKKKSVLL